MPTDESTPAPRSAAERIAAFEAFAAEPAFPLRRAEPAPPPEPPVVRQPVAPPAPVTDATAAAEASGQEAVMQLRDRILPHLIEHIEPGLLEAGREDELRLAAVRLAEERLTELRLPLTSTSRAEVVKVVVDAAVGLGPLSALLEDDSTSEIMVNGARRIYVERSGRLERLNTTFVDEPHLRQVVDRILKPLNRVVDEASPMADGRLPQGSRVNVVVPPVSLNGTAVTIRKFRRIPIQLKDMVKSKTLSSAMAAYLGSAVKSRLNVIVAGGGGSGKTTLLNVLSSFIPPEERIITVEDSAELQLQQAHVVRLETRPANGEGIGRVTVRDLVRNTLRMRPDRILVGECRGPEALDMMQAMNTGHDGSMTTLHANTPRDALARLEILTLMAGLELPDEAIREQISAAIQVIVQVSRMSDGSRRVTSITEVVGREGDHITLEELFRFEARGMDALGTVRGRLTGCGIVSKFEEMFRRRGCPVPPGSYQEAVEV